jgi:hypothetical protein
MHIMWEQGFGVSTSCLWTMPANEIYPGISNIVRWLSGFKTTLHLKEID